MGPYWNEKRFTRSVKVGRLTLTLMNRTSDECDRFFAYASWCWPSETFFAGRWELNVQNRRVKK